MKKKAENRHARCADLGELNAPRNHRLVEAIGELAAQSREKKEGRNEKRARHCDERFGIRSCEPVKNEKNQRVFQEIVVEG